MPGRNPVEAVDFFVVSIQAAVSCLGPAKVSLSQRGRSALDADHTLFLNRGQGMALHGGYRLDAEINYAIVRDGRTPSQPFRVTTHRYQHALLDPDGLEVISAHWHLTGQSPVKEPHWHIGSAALTPDGVLTPRAHIPSSRISIEEMVRLTIAQLNVPAVRDDWRDVLANSESTFAANRTW